jgi:hypothetical protein
VLDLLLAKKKQRWVPGFRRSPYLHGGPLLGSRSGFQPVFGQPARVVGEPTDLG